MFRISVLEVSGLFFFRSAQLVVLWMEEIPKNHLGYIKSGWWFQKFFIFTPIWGRFPIWLIFSDGLKPPTRNTLINNGIKTTHLNWLNGFQPSTGTIVCPVLSTSGYPSAASGPAWRCSRWRGYSGGMGWNQKQQGQNVDLQGFQMERVVVGREMYVFKLTPLTISIVALHFNGMVQCRCRWVQGFS